MPTAGLPRPLCTDSHVATPRSPALLDSHRSRDTAGAVLIREAADASRHAMTRCGRVTLKDAVGVWEEDMSAVKAGCQYILHKTSSYFVWIIGYRDYKLH